MFYNKLLGFEPTDNTISNEISLKKQQKKKFSFSRTYLNPWHVVYNMASKLMSYKNLDALIYTKSFIEP